jgi:hypothetical protein
MDGQAFFNACDALKNGVRRKPRRSPNGVEKAMDGLFQQFATTEISLKKHDIHYI